jgi:hypothetical protein
MLKNLDHYNAANPGSFSVYLWNATGSTLLATYPDTPAPALTLYPVSAVIPANTPNGTYVIQTIYAPQNPSAPAAFYQCSDVMVLAPQPGSGEHSHHDCMAEAEAKEAASNLRATKA